MCMDGIVQLLIMLPKPRTKLIRTNRNAYYMLIMLMLLKGFRTFIKSNLLWYRTLIGRVQYSNNAFMSAFYFEKACYIEA